MFASPDALSAWLKSTAAEFEDRIDELDGLDAAIGDGDHGTKLFRSTEVEAFIFFMWQKGYIVFEFTVAFEHDTGLEGPGNEFAGRS